MCTRHRRNKRENNLQPASAPPQRKNARKDSEETAALKVFLADSEKKNMVFEYDTPEEAKKRYDSMRNYRNTNKLQDIYDVWRSDALICIVKTKKGAARK